MPPEELDGVRGGTRVGSGGAESGVRLDGVPRAAGLPASAAGGFGEALLAVALAARGAAVLVGVGSVFSERDDVVELVGVTGAPRASDLASVTVSLEDAEPAGAMLGGGGTRAVRVAVRHCASWSYGTYVVRLNVAFVLAAGLAGFVAGFCSGTGSGSVSSASSVASGVWSVTEVLLGLVGVGGDPEPPQPGEGGGRSGVDCHGLRVGWPKRGDHATAVAEVGQVEVHSGLPRKQEPRPA